MGVLTVSAQSASVPVGDDAQSNNGSVCYTVGQIAVQTSLNSDGSVSVTEGVQQPYEIQTVSVDNYPQITLTPWFTPTRQRISSNCSSMGLTSLWMAYAPTSTTGTANCCKRSPLLRKSPSSKLANTPRATISWSCVTESVC